MTVEDDRYLSQELPGFGILSIWFGGLFVGITAVSQIIHRTLQPVWTRPVLAGMDLVLVIMIVASILFLAINHQYGIKIVAIPLMVNLGTLMIVQAVPFDMMWQNIRFSSMMYGFEGVVEKVETNELLADGQGFVVLPLGFRHLSANNNMVRVDRADGVLSVLFYLNYESPDHFSGYIFRSDQSAPPTNIFGAEWRVMSQQVENWYFVGSYP